MKEYIYTIELKGQQLTVTAQNKKQAKQQIQKEYKKVFKINIPAKAIKLK